MRETKMKLKPVTVRGRDDKPKTVTFPKWLLTEGDTYNVYINPDTGVITLEPTKKGKG